MAKALIAEDESIIALSMEMYTASNGHEVCGVASTGEQALKLWEAHQPDIMLVDIQLGGAVGGIELARQIRQCNCNIPIIFTSGNSDPATMKRVCDIPHCTYLAKPVMRDALNEALASMLGGLETVKVLR